MEKVKKFDPLTQLYRWECSPLSLSLNKEIQDNLETTNQLQELFQKHNIQTNRINVWGIIEPWETNEWNQALLQLKNQEISLERAEFFIGLENLAILYKEAMSKLKSFLAKSDFSFDEKYYIKKRGEIISRLFTYVKLRQAIKNEKLSHVYLPAKFLGIRKKDGTFATGEEAEKILEEIIKLEIGKPPFIKARLNYSGDYTLFVFAERKQNHRRSFNQEARKELKKLVKKVPFDVGYGNIFVDENGDAVIIDTEFKGESKKSSLNKLKDRYIS